MPVTSGKPRPRGCIIASGRRVSSCQFREPSTLEKNILLRKAGKGKFLESFCKDYPIRKVLYDTK
jgi:hypothetical protein